MTEAYNIFPPAQADNLIVYSAYSQYQRAAMAGYFVLTGCTASRTSASEVTVSSGTYSKGGIKADFTEDSIDSIAAAAAGKQRIDLFYIDCTDDTLKTLTGSEQTPSLSTNFLENQLPLPPDMTDEDWVILALVRVTEDGITDTTFGTYATGSVANIRFSGTVAVDNSTITISNGIISVANHASKHITSGTDEIDGDKLDIDWTPSNYTPATTPSEVDNVNNLSAHLYGIDQKLGNVLESDSFSESITFLTTDLASGKSGSVADFINNGSIIKLRLRANTNAGQLDPGYMVVNDATGLSPSDTSLAFDGQTGTWANGDYAMVVRTCEIIMINDADPATTPIDITRGHMGTTAAYIDDNDEIIRLNNGFTLDIFYDSNKYPYQRILRVENIMTSKATTDTAITATNKYLKLSGSMPNLYSGTKILIDDTVDEEAIVQTPPSDVATAGYDYVIYTEDALAAHDSGKDIYKVCEISGITIPYDPAGGTFYYTLYWREANLGANIAVTLDVYGEGY